jgi:arylsulfatase A-like enzyme
MGGEEIRADGGREIPPEIGARPLPAVVTAAGLLAALESARTLRGGDFDIALLAGGGAGRLLVWPALELLLAALLVALLRLPFARFETKSSGVASAASFLGILAILAELSPADSPPFALGAGAVVVALLAALPPGRLLGGGLHLLLRRFPSLPLLALLLPVVAVAGRLPGLSILQRGALFAGGGLLVELLRRLLPRLGVRPETAALAFSLMVVVGGAFAAGADSGRLPGATKGSGPDVLLVTVDTLRQDEAFPPAGSPVTMPNLARLAKEGTLFDRALSAAPCTVPSVAAIMTGRLPSSLGMTDPFDMRIGLGDPLASRLARRGWRTGAVVANGFAVPRSGFRSGFERLVPPWIHGPLAEPIFASRFLDGLSRLLLARPLRDPLRAEGAAPLVDRALEWLGEKDDRPFFLWLHFNDPHSPYFDAEGNAAGGGSLRDRSGLFSERLGDLDAWRIGREELLGAYRAELARVDLALGRLIEALAKRGTLDRTLVVVVSDHGEEFRDHGGYFHGATLYEEMLRVPLVVRWPASLPEGARGIRIGTRVRTIDVAPTISDVLGLPVDRYEGQSLRPLLVGPESEPDRDAIAEGTCFFEPRVAWYQESRKLVLTRDGAPVDFRDLVLDPKETGPSIEIPAETMARARGWLEPRRALLRGAAGEGRRRDEANLRALGYLR